MSLDFQQVRQQVIKFAENAPARERRIKALRQSARDLLADQALRHNELRDKVFLVARQFDPALRCALPVDPTMTGAEPLDVGFAQPDLPAQATILAADGSQITPDRHAEVFYGLINVGAIQMRLDQPDPPATTLRCQLYYDEALLTRTGAALSEAALALQRDLRERRMLVDLSRLARPPVITFTDGPMELWGARDADNAAEFQRSLDEYLAVLEELSSLQVITAGYVDRPSAGLVVRLLEVALAPLDGLKDIQNFHPLLGVNDIDLYGQLLDPGERSAVFAIQSKSAAQYAGALALHFFYLNAGRADHAYISRVEIPAWVAGDPQKVDALHSVLVSQCRLIGGQKPYPYLLHRAHETAVVSQEDKAQVTQMIALELRRRGVEVDGVSNKQSQKDLAPRTRYPR